jgi:hypothetical protein
MKSFCKLSGIQLSLSVSFESFHTENIHPIFLLKKSAILEIIRKNPESIFGFSIQEQQLLILSLLSSHSFLIQNEQFTALPEEQNLIPNLEKLLYLSELNLRNSTLIDLPKISISEPFDSLSGLPGFLDSLILELSGGNIEKANQSLLESMEQRIDILVRAINSGDKNKSRSLRASVASWAMEVVKDNFKPERVSKQIQTYWKEILKSHPKEIQEKGISASDIAELEDFMITYLPHGSISASEVLKQLNELKNCVGSLSSYLIQSSSKEAKVEQYVMKSKTPQRAEFPTLKEWMEALKAWNLENMRKEPVSSSASEILI